MEHSESNIQCERKACLISSLLKERNGWTPSLESKKNLLESVFPQNIFMPASDTVLKMISNNLSVKSMGLDSFCRKIGLLSKPEFGMFFSEKPERESVNCLVTKMRRIIQGYFVQDIRSNRSCPENNETFFYDSASIYIIKQQFELLLEEMEIESKQELLARLLEENMLVTNTDRYYFSLQLSGKRFRTVKLRLELFEKTGDVNILYLGKEKS